MARVARALRLPPEAVFGAVWKMSAREPFMQGKNRKKKMLEALDEWWWKTEGQVSCYAVVVVRDRYFMAASLNKDHTYYSNWLKQAHSQFARLVNDQTEVNGRPRVGPVGRYRPNTPPVDSIDDFKILIYAMAWCPVVSGEVRHPRECDASTYNLYAGNKVDPRVKNVSFPQWYMEMGLTWKQRQAAFTNECQRWYDEGILDEVIKDLNKDRPLSGEAYRKKMREYRKKILDLYMKKMGRLVELTLRYGFQPTLGHGRAVGQCAVNLALDLVAHVVWSAPPVK